MVPSGGSMILAHLKWAAVLGLAAITACSPASQFARMDAAEAITNAAPHPMDKPPQLAEAPDQSLVGEDGPVANLMAYAADVVTPDPGRTQINGMIAKYALEYAVPVSLVHHVVNRESTYNPKARNGKHMGLMQLNPATARTMGYRGPDAGLLDADTNLKFGVKYLAGAYMVAGGDAMRADRLYQSGYYYQAKRMGLLQETGLRP